MISFKFNKILMILAEILHGLGIGNFQGFVKVVMGLLRLNLGFICAISYLGCRQVMFPVS